LGDIRFGDINIAKASWEEFGVGSGVRHPSGGSRGNTGMEDEYGLSGFGANFICFWCGLFGVGIFQSRFRDPFFPALFLNPFFLASYWFGEHGTPP